MSHYTVIQTQVREVPALVAALQAMGYKNVEVHEQAQPLYGYQGDRRPESAEVIIRRQYVGGAANDVGFKRQASGEFQAIISEFDRRAHCPPSWLQRLNYEYARNLIEDQMQREVENDRIVERETLPNGSLVWTISERG